MFSSSVVFRMMLCYIWIRDSSVNMVTRLRAAGFRFPAGTGNFSLHHRVQTGSGAHLASYPMGTGGSFPGGKTARAEVKNA
jgi:hypothetical protein